MIERGNIQIQSPPCRDVSHGSKPQADGFSQGAMRGFTFLELIVVLSILAIMTAVIVPNFGSSLSAMKARSARGDFVALLYFVQELAVRESREIRLVIDQRNKSYWVEVWESGLGDDKVFHPLEDQVNGGIRYFPDAIELTQVHARTDRRHNLHYIACLPNGACDRARIRFENRASDQAAVTVATTGTLGGIQVSS